MKLIFILLFLASCKNPLVKTQYIQGPIGPQGESGPPGMNSGCTVSVIDVGVAVSCTDGTYVEVYNGINGTNGVGCSVERLSNGAQITCEDSIAIVYNGIDGESSVSSVIDVIDPCGDGIGVDEVLLKLDNDYLIRQYTKSVKLSYLSVMGPGNYKTNDIQGCTFNVNNNLTVTW